MELSIRRAESSDAAFLTSISVGAKRYWNYPEGYLEIWHDGVTITETYIEKNIVFVAKRKTTIIGYCSTVHLKEDEWRGETKLKAGYWLEHIFVRPAYIKSGVGSKLFEVLIHYCETNDIRLLNILGDSNASGFYHKMGAKYICNLPSNIEGRCLCAFEFVISPKVEESEAKKEGLIETRIQLKQEALEHKLYELDKDIDEDTENMKSKEGVAIEDFTFMDDIGYKFQYEESIMPETPSIIADQTQAYTIERIVEEEINDKSTKDNAFHEELQHIIERVSEDEEQTKQILIGPVNHEEVVEEISIKTEKQKMLEGEQYIAWGDDIIEDRRHARRLLKEFNLTDPEDKKQVMTVLKALLGSTGEYIHIEPDFKCNYGYNIHIGDNFYAGCHCVILDNAKVSIGDNCIISPQVGIYTLAYPINAKRRIAGYEYAKPIVIGNNVWIGGGSMIGPGVTIGDDVVIKPGSMIISDIPDRVVVGGNPAKIIKEVDD